MYRYINVNGSIEYSHQQAQRRKYTASTTVFGIIHLILFNDAYIPILIDNSSTYISSIRKRIPTGMTKYLAKSLLTICCVCTEHGKGYQHRERVSKTDSEIICGVTRTPPWKYGILIGKYEL